MPLIDQGYYPHNTVKGALRKWRAFLFMGGVLCGMEGMGLMGIMGDVKVIMRLMAKKWPFHRQRIVQQGLCGDTEKSYLRK